MSQNTRLCMHSCAKDYQRKRPTLNPRIRPVLSDFFCSTSASSSSRTVPRPSSNTATRKMSKTRRDASWPSARCSATSSSSASWESWRLCRRASYIGAFRNCWLPGRGTIHRRTSSASARFCGHAAVSWTRIRAKS